MGQDLTTFDVGFTAHFHGRIDCAPKEPSRERSDEILLGQARCGAIRSKTAGRGVLNNHESSIGQPQTPLELWWRAWRAGIRRETATAGNRLINLKRK